MAGLKEIRTRINSITSTQKITSAMKMVSAAKFHKANETLNRFKPYSRKVFDVLSQIIPSVPESKIAEWFSPRVSHKKFALVVLTSNSSMCAGFNQNLLKKIMEDGPSLFQECWCTDNLEVFCLGKKGGDYLSKRGFNIMVNDNLIVNKPRFDEAEKICSSLIERFLSNDLDAVYVAYNQFVNPALQTPTITKFLPYTLPEEIKMVPTNPNLIFEPNKEDILEILIP